MAEIIKDRIQALASAGNICKLNTNKLIFTHATIPVL